MSSPLDTPLFFDESRSATRGPLSESFDGSGWSLRACGRGRATPLGGPSFISHLRAASPLDPERVVRVLLADPSELFREALLDHLEEQADLFVVDAVANGLEALAVCESYEVDVLLCAGDGSSLSLGELAKALRASSPDTRLLVLCAGASPAEEEALRAGAWGLVSRRQSAGHIIRSLRAVGAGQLWVSRETLCRLARIELLAPLQVSRKSERSFLSDREQEIVRLLAAGLTNDCIAEKLFVETCTVRTHLRRIFRKLGVHDRRSAVVAAEDRSWTASPATAVGKVLRKDYNPPANVTPLSS